MAVLIDGNALPIALAASSGGPARWGDVRRRRVTENFPVWVGLSVNSDPVLPIDFYGTESVSGRQAPRTHRGSRST